MQSKKGTMQKSSRRSKAMEAMEEAMEARMLKPSISGDHLDFEEAAQRALASSSSSSSTDKKLDLNAPLLSVRRLRAADAPSNARIQGAQQAAEQCSSSSPSGNVNWDSKSMRRPAAVPYFVWEQQQQQKQRRRGGGSGGRAAGFLPVLTPPPGRLSPVHHHACSQPGVEEHPATAGDGLLQLGDLDARSDTLFAHTEQAPSSVAATCLVSLLDDADDDEDCVVGQQQEQEEEMVCMDAAAAREFILRRFLPAARAVAHELAPRQAGSFAVSDVWKPLMTNPSPQRLPSSRSQHEIQAQRQRFQDLLYEEEEVEEEEDEEYESSSVVGGNICGFFPLFKLGGTMKLFRSSNGNQVHHHQQQQQQQQQQQAPHPPMRSKTWRKIEPEQRAAGEDDIECWSDEDGNDDPSLRRDSASYLACRYTPSRGNLGSPITIASRGFLGTPTDRVWRETSIKRMYPIDPYETTISTTKNSSRSNCNKVNCHANPADADSDSSESLLSLRLDKLSATTSRQSSVNEKIFCLDTLNQVREEAAKQRCSSEEVVETYSVVDERGHPNVVVPSDNQALRNSADKQQQLGELMEEAAKILYTSKRSAPHLKRAAAAPAPPPEVKVTEVEMNTSKKSFEEDGNYALPAEMRICWHEEDGDDKPQAMSLPAPVGPSQSWLTSARLSSASKPPLGKPKPKQHPKLDQYSMHRRGELVYTKVI